MHLSSHDPPRAPLLAFHCSQCQRLPCCFDFDQASPIASKTSLLQPLAWRRKKKKRKARTRHAVCRCSWLPKRLTERPTARSATSHWILVRSPALREQASMHPRETCDFAQRCASSVVFTNALSFPGPPIRVRCAEHEQPVQGSRRHASHPHELGRVHSGRSTFDCKSDLAVLKILAELFRPSREKRGVVKSERESVCVYYASITGGLRSPLAVISNQGNFGGHACKAPCAEYAHGKRSSLTILSSRIFDITTKTLRKPSPLSHSFATISRRRRADRAVVHMTHHT